MLALVNVTIPLVTNLEIRCFLEGLTLKLFLSMVTDPFLQMYLDHLGKV